MKHYTTLLLLLLCMRAQAYGTDDGPGGIYYGGDAARGLYFNVDGNYSSRGSDRVLCERIDEARNNEELYEDEEG